jgi:hypothetical protein
MSKRDYEADAIKLAAVVTAAPRWVGALLEAEGVPVPPDWLPLWRVGTALLSLGMAFAEAFAINYVFNAWRNQRDKRAHKLLLLAIVSLVCFTLVLAPYIAANVRGLKLAGVLANDVLWWSWSAAVAASTFVVVASVGYAQKREQEAAEHEPHAARPAPLSCEVCGAVANKQGRAFANQQQVNAHMREHRNGHSKVSEVVADNGIERSQ